MLNPAHVLETALLILVAFLLGCALGYLARRLMDPARPATAGGTAEAAPAEAGAAAPLVVAPTIAPLAGARRRTPAERLAAAAGRDRSLDAPAPALAGTDTLAANSAASPSPGAAAEPVAGSSALLAMMQPAGAGAATEGWPSVRRIEPAHVAGEAVSIVAGAGGVEAPAVVPETPPQRVEAEDVPDIDERTHVLDPAFPEPPKGDPAPAADVELDAALAASGEGGKPVAKAVLDATATALLGEDPEAAAMRAIEGGWTPTTRRPAEGPVPHPEHAVAMEVEAAMANARSAVAAATAAAAAVVAESTEAVGGTIDAAGREMRFEAAPAGTPDDILDERAPPPKSGGLEFEPAPAASHGFGRPDGLPAPRQGQPDDLKHIKGISPQLEASLNGLGIFHFDQIAAWDRKAIVWIDAHLGLRGRIGRDKWIEQARALEGGHAQPARPVRR